MTLIPDIDESGEIVINSKIKRSHLNDEQVENFFKRDDMNQYKKYSINFFNIENLQHSLFVLSEQQAFQLRPKHIKSFSQSIKDVRFINRNYILYALDTKIQIYKGITNGELLNTIAVAQLLDPIQLIPLYSYSLDSEQEEIMKFAAIAPET